MYISVQESGKVHFSNIQVKRVLSLNSLLTFHYGRKKRMQQFKKVPIKILTILSKSGIVITCPNESISHLAE